MRPLSELTEGELFEQLAFEDDRPFYTCRNLLWVGTLDRMLDAALEDYKADVVRQIFGSRPLLQGLVPAAPTRWQRVKRWLRKRPHLSLEWW